MTTCFIFHNIKKNQVNSLPNDNFLDRTKFKAFGDDKLNVAKIMISVFYRVENNISKRLLSRGR